KPGEHFLHGVLSQISLEPVANTTMIIMKVSNQTFSFRIPLDKAREMALFPGQKMYISYPLSSVRWY
ncbi:MAG: hypothetical protein KKF00_00080, partial [Proteobacteria bacterium]|nr:hypothetical protein [Pseudomonadota bacterium]